MESLNRKPRCWVRGLQGTLLGTGAPLGWLLVQCFGGHSPAAEIAAHSGLYLYMLLGSMGTFFLFGFLLGRSEDRLEVLVLNDPVTGLKNVRYFRARLTEEVARAQRGKQSLVVMLADIDHFKKVNDQYGHTAGDHVLIAVAHALEDEVRDSDTVARVGGEEFAFVLPGCASTEALMVGERIRRRIEKTSVGIADTDQKISVTVSIGVFVVNKDTTPTGKRKNITQQEAYCTADQALYQAKENGRNQVVVAGESADNKTAPKEARTE